MPHCSQAAFAFCQHATFQTFVNVIAHTPRSLQRLVTNMHASSPCTIQLPSTEELEAMFADRKMNTIVFFLDETFEELSFDVTTTVLEAVEQLAGIIKLQVKMHGWGQRDISTFVHFTYM